MRKNSRGFLLIGAIILIIIIGVVSVVISHITATSTEASSLSADHYNAEQVSRAGIQKAEYDINQASSFDCETFGSSTGLIEFNNGQFSISGKPYTSTNPAELFAKIDSTTTTLGITALSNDENPNTEYAPFGRAVIGNEIVEYGRLSSNSSICGDAPYCLTGVKRGVDGTAAADHNANTGVNQNTCIVTSTGSVPSEKHPLAEHKIAGEVVQKKSNWIIGQLSNSHETILYQQGEDWKKLPPSDSLTNATLTGIDMISANDGWAVGEKSGVNSTIFHWNGNSWSVNTDLNGINKNINAISCVATDDCWAVGLGRGIYHYSDNAGADDLKWRLIGTDQIENGSGPDAISKTVNLTAVSCASANDCWAVGMAYKNIPLYIHWDGTEWSKVSTNTTPLSIGSGYFKNNLTGVACVNSNNCWAVGYKNGKKANINNFDGTSWSRINTLSNLNMSLLAVTCVNADDCWAVGGKKTIIHYKDKKWTVSNSGGSTALYAVACENKDSCWAVGDSRTILHYNGTDWEPYVSSSLNADLNKNTRLRSIGIPPPTDEPAVELVNIRDL